MPRNVGALFLDSAPRERLTRAEERRLALRFTHAGDERALWALIRAHLRLAARVASQFWRAYGPGLELEDLQQQALLGLTIAARGFKPAKGARLSTYAVYWMRAFLQDYLLRTRWPVRVGTTTTQRRVIFGLSRAEQALRNRGLEPTREALARALEVREDELAALWPRLRGVDYSLDEDREPRVPGSLVLCTSPETLVADAEERGLAWRSLWRRLQRLPERERFVLWARYLCPQPQTLLVISQRLGLSPERVRQIERRALQGLREADGDAKGSRSGRRRGGAATATAAATS